MTEYCLPERDKVALVTISAQNDFIRPGSALCANGHKRALKPLENVVKAFREGRAPIFHSVRLYRPDGSNVEACRRSAFDEGLRVLMPGSIGAEVISTLKPDPEVRLDPEILFDGGFQELGVNEKVFYRPRWGAFHETRLGAELETLGITTIVICGFSFSTGTRATIYEASARDLRIVLVPDAVCNSTEAGIAELGRIGVYLMSSDYCVNWVLERGRSVAA
ncbi:MAG: isochorismatase family cysteine hydrolase [Kiloniellales bacterium]|nr:isochorismatase family cysteine hydrolase [Kiloniellales bacterium]